MRAIQGVTKLPLNSPTVAGNHRITVDHNFEYGNYAVLSHETRHTNYDGRVQILSVNSTSAAAAFQQALNANEDRRYTVQPRITDADRTDTTRTRGAAITKEVK